ncbi:MAG: EpsG family protein [Pedobacter sp.]|nr:MAG: EpsG family protein [Pedobacter sp.]
MLTYFAIFVFVVTFSFRDFLEISRENKAFVGYFSLITLICFFGFRFECDNDYDNYVGIFENTPSLSTGINSVLTYGLLVGVELGYCLVSAAFKTLSFSPQSIFIFSAAVTFILIHKCFSKLAIYPGTSMLLYFSQFFSLPFIQMRFGIAMAIVLLACYRLFVGKTVQYWLLILIGCLFHISALGGIAVFFFFIIKWDSKPRLILLVIFGSVFMMLLPMRNLLITSLGVVGIEKYSKLYEDTGSASPFSVLLNLIIILPLIFYRKAFATKNIKININALLSMALASIFVGCIVWQLGILNRFSMISASVLCLIILCICFYLRIGEINLLVFC